MKQEVQIILTLEVDADKNKEDIKRFFWDMENTYTQTVSAKNRWEFSKITLIDIKEEAEIYTMQETIKEDSHVSLEDAANPLFEVHQHQNGNFQVVKKFSGCWGILCEVEVFPYSDKAKCREIAQNIATQTNEYPTLKEQYSLLVSSYGELLEALQKIEAKSWHKNEWQDMQAINDIAKPFLQKANNILKQFKP